MDIGLKVALVGNPGDGFTVSGPFSSFDEMDAEWSRSGTEWWGMTLHLPDYDQWACDFIQFARFIAEVKAAGAIKMESLQDMAASMDLTIEQLDEIADRAQLMWDNIVHESIGIIVASPEFEDLVGD